MPRGPDIMLSAPILVVDDNPETLNLLAHALDTAGIQVRRASSVESCSGEGSGRAMSENCTTRPGVGSTATTTRSIGADGGFDSRSSSASVRSVRASRIGAGNSSDRS